MGYTLELYVTVENGDLDLVKARLNTEIYERGDTAGYRFNKAPGYGVLYVDIHAGWDYTSLFVRVSRLFPAAIIAVDMWPAEPYFNGIKRIYYCNGMQHEVKADIVFPPHSFMPPNKEYRMVNVIVMGREVPVEIECYATTTEDEAYEIAKNIVKSTL